MWQGSCRYAQCQITTCPDKRRIEVIRREVGGAGWCTHSVLLCGGGPGSVWFSLALLLLSRSTSSASSWLRWAVTLKANMDTSTHLYSKQFLRIEVWNTPWWTCSEPNHSERNLHRGDLLLCSKLHQYRAGGEWADSDRTERKVDAWGLLQDICYFLDFHMSSVWSL